MANIIVVPQQPPADGNQPKVQYVPIDGQEVPSLLAVPTRQDAND